MPGGRDDELDEPVANFENEKARLSTHNHQGSEFFDQVPPRDSL
jgi:hypothetical protein